MLRRTSDKNIISVFNFVMPHIFSVWFHFAEADMFNELQLIIEIVNSLPPKKADIATG
jgi:hypothetical protein